MRGSRGPSTPLGGTLTSVWPGLGTGRACDVCWGAPAFIITGLRATREDTTVGAGPVSLSRWLLAPNLPPDEPAGTRIPAKAAGPTPSPKQSSNPPLNFARRRVDVTPRHGQTGCLASEEAAVDGLRWKPRWATPESWLRLYTGGFQRPEW